MLDRIRKYAAAMVITADVLVLPLWLLGLWLSDVMLTRGKPCTWAVFGARCGTCGGTHCVQSFLHGEFFEALCHNPMVFLCILYGIFTLVLLNLAFLAKKELAVSILKRMYSVAALFITLGAFTVYTVVINIPFLMNWIG